ncbi:MAG: hypothetical protein U5Q03_01945 [Bacteroidota bacterium]|nr:hypothetical protein [Bacteroidota bacterium]
MSEFSMFKPELILLDSTVLNGFHDAFIKNPALHDAIIVLMLQEGERKKELNGAGTCEYLSKPIEPQVLKNTLERIKTRVKSRAVYRPTDQ